MTREDEILKMIRNGISRYSDELAGYKVLLFGSRARRDHRDNSDFDIGVYGQKPISPGIFYKISDYLDELPTLYRIDWVDLNRASDELRNDVLKNALVIYGQ